MRCRGACGRYEEFVVKKEERRRNSLEIGIYKPAFISYILKLNEKNRDKFYNRFESSFKH